MIKLKIFLLFLCILFVDFNFIYAEEEIFCKLIIKDAITRDSLSYSDGVTITVNFERVVVLVNWTERLGYSGESYWIATKYYETQLSSKNFTYNGGTQNVSAYVDLSTLSEKSNFLTNTYYQSGQRWVSSAKMRIKISAVNYESQEIYVSKESGGTPLTEVYLVPQKFNVDAKVNLQGTSSINEKSKELDIFTAEEIADYLDVELNEIIKLIKQKKLKAKKIGETYFIRKKDFDSFMEK